MRITLLRTRPQGQETIGIITYAAGRITADSAAQPFLEALLRGIDRTDEQAVAAGLRRAERVFDGGYIRARVEG